MESNKGGGIREKEWENTSHNRKYKAIHMTMMPSKGKTTYCNFCRMYARNRFDKWHKRCTLQPKQNSATTDWYALTAGSKRLQTQFSQNIYLRYICLFTQELGLNSQF